MTIDQREATAVPRIETAVVDEDNLVPRRITVTLIVRVRAELKRLMDTTTLSLTDVVNRAVSIYFLISAHDRAGYEMVFRHRETGHERVVEIL
jgi:hypothetical protein